MATVVKLVYSNIDIKNTENIFDFDLYADDGNIHSQAIIVVNNLITASTIDNAITIAWRELKIMLGKCAYITEMCIQDRNNGINTELRNIFSINMINLDDCFNFNVKFCSADNKNSTLTTYVSLPKADINDENNAIDEALKALCKLLRTFEQHVYEKINSNDGVFNRYLM